MNRRGFWKELMGRTHTFLDGMRGHDFCTYAELEQMEDSLFATLVVAQTGRFRLELAGEEVLAVGKDGHHPLFQLKSPESEAFNQMNGSNDLARIHWLCSKRFPDVPPEELWLKIRQLVVRLTAERVVVPMSVPTP